MPRTNEAWRDHVAEELRRIASEFRIGDDRMGTLEESVRVNTQLTTELKNDTSELLDIFRAMRGGLKVLGWLGNGLKWAVGLGAAFTTLWATVTGKMPRL